MKTRRLENVKARKSEGEKVRPAPSRSLSLSHLACPLSCLLAGSAAALDIGLVWNPNPSPQQIQAYYVYQSTNLIGPYTLVTNSATNAIRVALTNADQYFFFVTASNFWGESLPSNSASTPLVAQGPVNLKISR